MDMNNSKKNLETVFAGACMLIMILDSKLVLEGAVDGVKLCLWTVLPSLFPFFVVSPLVCGSIDGKCARFLHPLGKLCGIPSGSEGILLTGFLGGYPIGAKGIMDAYSSGALSKHNALRMLAFCNNAGPAFIFGMVSQHFNSVAVAWVLWLITILSSVFVAISIPGKSAGSGNYQQPALPGISQLITNAVKAMSNVCAWVILFRIILTLLQKRLFCDSYPLLQTILFGFLELSNGILEAANYSNPHIRFVLCAVFLSAGVLCIAMQTHSITKVLGLRTNYLGKTLQTIYEVLLSVMLIPATFPGSKIATSLISAFICSILLLFTQVFKKSIAFSKKVVYNIKK